MIRSDRRLTLLYAAGDFLTLIGTFAGINIFYKEHTLGNQDYLYLLTLLLTWVFITSKNKVYLLHLHNGLTYRLKNHVKSHFEFIAILCLFYLILGIPIGYTKQQFIGFLLGYPAVNIVVNYVLYTIVRTMRLNGKNVRKALVIGAGRVGTHIESYFSHNMDFGYHIVGFLDDQPEAMQGPRTELDGRR